MATVASDLVGPADAECLHSQELTAAWRWSVLIGGAVVLGLGPAAPAMLERALSPRVPGEWALALYQGFAVASEVVPSLVLGIVAALSWRPAWQRVLVLAPAFAVQLVSYVLFWCRGAQSNRAWGALLLFPLVIMAAASPAFLLRLWRQWTLVPEANRVRPRPASIISLMLAMACWAGAAACTQWVSGDGGGLWVEPKLEDAPGLDTLAKLVAAVVFLLIPGAFIGLSLVLSLRAALLRSLRRACWTWSAVALATDAVSLVTVLTLVRLTFRVNDGPPSKDSLLYLALAVSSFCLTAHAIHVIAFCTLRLLGYRLIHRGSLLESR